MSQCVEEDDAGLKDLVSRTLLENGALGKIQAQLRASVFLALEDEFREKDVPLCNPRTMELLQTPSGSLAASLVHDFFTCLGLDFSLAVYGPESNLGAKLWDLHTRDCLLNVLGFAEDHEPMTPLLLRLCSRRPAVPVAAGDTPHLFQASRKPLHGMGKIPPITPTNTNQATKNGASKITINNVSSIEPRNSLSANSSKPHGTGPANNSGVPMSSLVAPKSNTKTSNGSNINEGSNKRTSSTRSAAASNSNLNSINNNKNNNNDKASATCLKDTPTSQKTHQLPKPHMMSPPDDILTTAPPDTDSSEASSSVGDVANLLQGRRENRLEVANGVAAGKLKDVEKEKALSDGDYEDDFSESSSKSSASATNEEESSTSSWGHPPLPVAKIEKPPNFAKKNISETTDSKPSKEDKEKTKEKADTDNGSASRRRSLDLLDDDDVSIGDFVSSESSSAREETEDIADIKHGITLDYQEKV